MYFESKNFNHTPEVTVVFPINIRYNLPITVNEIVIGNYFTCATMKVPLHLDSKTLLSKIHKNLTKIKNSAQTYGMYIVSLISGALMPYEFTYYLLHEASRRVSF
jgi:NRPS condensation-like uncharacterized protein